MATQLYELALEHDGVFTAHEAALYGLDNDALVTSARRGAIQRLSRGIYRLKNFPVDEHRAQLWEAVLWPSTQRGPDATGVISHLSALSELCGPLDYTPSRIDVTIAKSLRIRRTAPPWLMVHRADIDDSRDLHPDAPVPTTSLKRTLQDCIDSGVDRRLIQYALDISVARGLAGITEFDAAHFRKQVTSS